MKFCSQLKNTVAKPLGAIALASMAMLGARLSRLKPKRFTSA